VKPEKNRRKRSREDQIRGEDFHGASQRQLAHAWGRRDKAARRRSPGRVRPKDEKRRRSTRTVHGGGGLQAGRAARSSRSRRRRRTKGAASRPQRRGCPCCHSAIGYAAPPRGSSRSHAFAGCVFIFCAHSPAPGLPRRVIRQCVDRWMSLLEARAIEGSRFEIPLSRQGVLISSSGRIVIPLIIAYPVSQS